MIRIVTSREDGVSTRNESRAHPRPREVYGMECNVMHADRVCARAEEEEDDDNNEAVFVRNCPRRVRPYPPILVYSSTTPK